MAERLLNISPNDPRRKEGFILTQLRALRDLGWNVTAGFVSSDLASSMADPEINYVGAPLEPVPVPRTPSERAARAAQTLFRRNSEAADCADLAVWTRVIERADPAAILVQFGPTAARLLPVLIDSGRPWAVQFHGYDLTERCRHWGYRLALSSILRHVDAAFVCSAFLKWELQRRVGGVAADRKVRIITPGYDEDRFTFVKSRRPARESIEVVSVGRLVDVKGHDIGIRAVAKAGGNLRLTIVGDGPERQRLERLAAELGIADRIVFRGGLTPSGVVSALQGARIFLQLSRTTASGATEGLGLSPIEAAATGLPLVVSNSGGLPETCLDGETGFVIPEGDPEAAAAALCRLAENLTMANAMGAAGARWVSASFASRVQARRASDILRNLRSERRRGAAP